MKTLKQLEKDYILQTFYKCQANKTKTADLLGITIKTLYNKLEIYGEDEPYDPVFTSNEAQKYRDNAKKDADVILQANRTNVNEVCNLMKIKEESKKVLDGVKTYLGMIDTNIKNERPKVALSVLDQAFKDIEKHEAQVSICEKPDLENFKAGLAT